MNLLTQNGKLKKTSAVIGKRVFNFVMLAKVLISGVMLNQHLKSAMR